MDYRDKPPSNETGSSFNRRNPAKWVRIRPALTEVTNGDPKLVKHCDIASKVAQLRTASDPL